LKKEYFKKQIEEGATEMFFYAVMREGNLTIQRHRGTLDTLPELEYVSHLTDGVPLFKDYINGIDPETRIGANGPVKGTA